MDRADPTSVFYWHITRRNRGVSFAEVIGELNLFLNGWVPASVTRRARVICNAWTNGFAKNFAACASSSANAPARSLSSCTNWGVQVACLDWRAGRQGLVAFKRQPPATEGMLLAWFESQGLVSLTARYEQLNVKRNRRIR